MYELYFNIKSISCLKSIAVHDIGLRVSTSLSESLERYQKSDRILWHLLSPLAAAWLRTARPAPASTSPTARSPCGLPLCPAERPSTRAAVDRALDWMTTYARCAGCRSGGGPPGLRHQDLRAGKRLRAVQLLRRSGGLHQVRMAGRAWAAGEVEAEGMQKALAGGVYPDD